MTADDGTIDGCTSIRNGHLFIDDCDTVQLAREFGTPLFVVSESRIRDNYRRIYKAFADRWPEGEVHVLPALKASPYIAVRRVLSQEGAGCDTFGPSELECAIQGGTDAGLISINGSVKTRETIRRGIEIGARIVIDAPRELEIVLGEARSAGKRARIVFRLKPVLEGLDTTSDFHSGLIRDITQRVRYGIPYNEVQELGPVALAASQHVEILGFHCHIGRQSVEMHVWECLVANFVKLAGELSQRWGMRSWKPLFDFGGGYAPPHDYDTDHANRGQPAPPIENYARAMTATFRSALVEHRFDPKGITLEIEPGRGLHADTGLHLATVINMKHSELIHQTWAETDTSEFFVGTWSMDTSVAPFRFRTANKANAHETTTLDIVGKSCGGEFILVDARTPALEAGDVIAFLDTGGYIETLGCNFNALPRPGTVLVTRDQAAWIRRPETIEQVFMRDVIPNGLGGRDTPSASLRTSV